MSNIGPTWQHFYFEAQKKELIEAIEITARGVLRAQQARKTVMDELAAAYKREEAEALESCEKNVKIAVDAANQAVKAYEAWQKENRGTDERPN